MKGDNETMEKEYDKSTLKSVLNLIKDKIQKMGSDGLWKLETDVDREKMKSFIDNGNTSGFISHLIKVFGLESDIKNELGITDIRKLLLGIKQNKQMECYVKTIETKNLSHLYENKPIKPLIDKQMDVWLETLREV